MPVHPFDPFRGRIETLTVDSDALRGNLLGDPTSRTVDTLMRLQLPSGVDIVTADYRFGAGADLGLGIRYEMDRTGHAASIRGGFAGVIATS